MELCPLEVAELMRPQKFLDNCWGEKKTEKKQQHCHPFCCYYPWCFDPRTLNTIYLHHLCIWKLLVGTRPLSSATETGKILLRVKIWVKNCRLPLTHKDIWGKRSQLHFIILALLASERLQPSRPNPCKTSAVSASRGESFPPQPLTALQLVFGSCWQISYFSPHHLINFHIPPSVHRAGCAYLSVLRVSYVIVAKKATLCFQSGWLDCFLFVSRITGPVFIIFWGRRHRGSRKKSAQF